MIKVSTFVQVSWLLLTGTHKLSQPQQENHFLLLLGSVGQDFSRHRVRIACLYTVMSGTSAGKTRWLEGYATSSASPPITHLQDHWAVATWASWLFLNIPGRLLPHGLYISAKALLTQIPTRLGHSPSQLPSA